MRFPCDRTHYISVVSTREGSLPLLFVDSPHGGRLMLEQVALVRHMASQGYSPSQQLKLTESIGRFCDWVHQAEKSPLKPEMLPGALRRFLVARYSGTILADGTDPSSLYWLPAKAQTVEMDRRNLNKLSDFVAREFGYFPLNPSYILDEYSTQTISFREVQFLLSNRRGQFDMLNYVAHKRTPAANFVVRRSRAGRQQRTDDAHAFPLDRLADLIHNEKSVVKRMIFIELAFGGVRISEALNHFITDVIPGSMRAALFPDDIPSELPLIVLADPVQSIYTDTFAFSTEDRRQYLSRKFGLISRPERARRGDSLHAGWKGMAHDNTNLLISQVYWSHPTWARLYLDLYRQLLEIRASVPERIRKSHPYLYINDSPSKAEFGMPVKMHSIQKSFARASERIGIQPYRSKVSLHGLRHAYKRQLRLLEMKPSTIQRCMHHSSPDSQDVYDRVSAAEINAAILRVQPK